MVLMIPGVYRGNKKLDHFVPKTEDMEEMGKFNNSFGQVGLKIIDAMGLHPFTKGARVNPLERPREAALFKSRTHSFHRETLDQTL